MLSKYKVGDRIKFRSVGEWGQSIIIAAHIVDLFVAEHIWVYVVIVDGNQVHVKESQLVEYKVQGIDY